MGARTYVDMVHIPTREPRGARMGARVRKHNTLDLIQRADETMGIHTTQHSARRRTNKKLC